MIRVRQILDTFLAPFSLHHMIIIIFDWIMRGTKIWAEISKNNSVSIEVDSMFLNYTKLQRHKSTENARKFALLRGWINDNEVIKI